ncbi:response regulator transcription factor [Paenibacillus jilunlii]|uniref:AraC family transcriptional regulator n=1 Tax=Paenibacillus jilunlii TaxID=682956 RepID=A0A1G9PMC2_9BACL|nr:response regulator [Paenibacillus jilunlii]KWX70611.1 AraC family transcriptional regulator [Paenibacillus jilunlii]SDL99930.1 two component transcriptional regulator, AraC family [Paenibacillus jilunlii]
MYNVLVADDEPRHRRGIADMIKQLRPEYRIFMVKDGLEALRIIEDNRIDIILTDIRMPNMDGLTLIEQMESRRELVKIVILSVYGNFDYARQALQLGAFDYLLKPLAFKELSEILDKLDTAMEKERLSLQDGAVLRQRLSSAAPVYEQHLLNRWMRSSSSEEELQEIRRLFPAISGGFVMLAKFRKREIAESYTLEDFEELKASVKNWMKEIYQTVGPSVSFNLEGADPMIGSIVTSAHSLEWLLKRDMEQFRQFIRQVRDEFGLTLTLGAGNWMADLYSGAPQSFEQAQKALEYTFYTGAGQLVLYDEIAYNPDKPSLKMVPADTGITDALARLDRDTVAQALKALIQRLLEGDCPSPAHLKDCVLYALVNEVKGSEVFLRQEEASNFISELEFQIPACESLDEVEQRAIYYLNRIMESIEERKDNKSGRTISLCKAFLEAHYMEDLSLEYVARQFFFSPAYFSSFFKQHTSMTFTEYLLRLRMDKAKALLQNGDLKISAIALSVGFRDAGYFTRVFKRETGLSPEEFRKKDVL